MTDKDVLKIAGWLVADELCEEQTEYCDKSCIECQLAVQERLRQMVQKDVGVEKPQGEREFIEILAQYVPDDICTYPEYRGKPYYSIHYKENGEEFVGFGTYNPEVLSRYLRDYFIKGDAE